MSYRDQVAEEISEVAQNNNNEPEETLEQIEVDFGETPFVKFYPTALVAGTLPEKSEGNPIIRFPDQDNNDDRRDQGYLGIVLDDVYVDTSEEDDLDQTTILKTGESDSTEYRIVNYADEQTTESMGGDLVNISGDKYEVADTSTEIDGRVILVVDRTAALSVARKLDVAGGRPASMDQGTGQPNGGLVEYAPDDEDTEVGRRYARNPELREEFYGEEVGIMVSRRSEADDEATGYLGEDGDANGGEPVLGEGEDGETHTDPSKASYKELVEAQERRDMMWYTVFDMETSETISPVDPDDVMPAGYTYLEWRFDPTAGHLPDDQWNFVQQYISHDQPDDRETIIQNIEANEEQFTESPNVDRMVELIQNEVTAS